MGVNKRVRRITECKPEGARSRGRPIFGSMDRVNRDPKHLNERMVNGRKGHSVTVMILKEPTFVMLMIMIYIKIDCLLFSSL